MNKNEIKPHYRANFIKNIVFWVENKGPKHSKGIEPMF